MFRGTFSAPPVVLVHFTLPLPDYFSDQLRCQLYLCCKERSPERNQLRSSRHENFQNGFKLDPSDSVVDPLGAIKRHERLGI